MPEPPVHEQPVQETPLPETVLVAVQVVEDAEVAASAVGGAALPPIEPVGDRFASCVRLVADDVGVSGAVRSAADAARASVICEATFADPAMALEVGIRTMWDLQRAAAPASPGVAIGLDLVDPPGEGPSAAQRLALLANRDQIVFTAEVERHCSMPDARPMGQLSRTDGSSTTVWLSTDSRPNVGRLALRLGDK